MTIKIQYQQKFHKNFKKRIAANNKLVNRFRQRLTLLQSNPNSPILKNHKLKGKMKNYFSFSISNNCRVVYKQVNNSIILIDIGTHNQVY